LTNAREQLIAFDAMIADAVEASYRRDMPPEIADQFLATDPLLSWRLIEQFFDPYQAAGVYPLNRLPALAYRAMDLKMQFYFTAQIAPGLHNQVLSDKGFRFDADPFSQPGLYLKHLCLMQAQISQVRILWDRMMSLIYLLEEGNEPPGKSIRRAFFTGLGRWNGRWDVFDDWERRLDKYDNLYRTPELHKNSTLRASLFGTPIDPNAILAPLQPVMSGFWQVLTANVAGTPSTVRMLGRMLDPEFDGPAPPA
ncbi:MAG: hypothetical protein KAH46_28275, partial [Mycobacterium sp.]|nr:hypothetical protein [Mycobacterium sp.]